MQAQEERKVVQKEFYYKQIEHPNHQSDQVAQNSLYEQCMSPVEGRVNESFLSLLTVDDVQDAICEGRSSQNSLMMPS